MPMNDWVEIVGRIQNQKREQGMLKIRWNQINIPPFSSIFGNEEVKMRREEGSRTRLWRMRVYVSDNEETSKVTVKKDVRKELDGYPRGVAMVTILPNNTRFHLSLCIFGGVALSISLFRSFYQRICTRSTPPSPSA